MSKAIKTVEDLKEFWKVFSEVYGEGIFIKSDAHPCGWDYVDLTAFYSEEDMMEIALIDDDFSGGNYENHEYEGWTPFSMLKDLGENWCFERNDINWD